MGFSNDDYIKIAIGVLSLLGTAATVAPMWAKDLNLSAQRIRILDEATKRVTFWDAWLKTLTAANIQQDISTSQSRVQAELMLVAEIVDQVFHRPTATTPTGGKDPLFSRPWWKRWFLVYKPPRSRAWIPRFLFYLYMAALPYSLVDDVKVSVGILILIFAFRALSIWAEKPRVPKHST